MKNSFYFSISIIILSCLTAYSQTSYLNLSLFDDSEFTVQFDGRDFYERGNTAEFDNISPGEHFIRVTKDNPELDRPTEEVLFSGNIKIPSNQAVFAVIDEYGTFLIYKKVRYEKRWDVTCRNDRRKYIHGDNSNETERHRDKDKRKDECAYRIMKEEDFRDLKSTINNMTFESTNLSVVKTALDKNMVSVNQVKDLLNYFTFEDSKLEVAKYAYKNTCDKKNYFKIYDSFSFSSSVDELKNYISAQK